MRVCSLLPSATEIIGSLGLADCLVGRSEECDWPPEVRSVPVVTAARVDTTRLSSREIDRAVRSSLTDGRSLYALEAAVVEALAPDLIVTQDTCAVCAISTGEVRRLCPVDADVVSLDARDIAGIEDAVRLVAERLHVSVRGERLVATMRDAIERTRTAVAGRQRRPVFVAEWLDPPFAAGHWVPEMVEAAGGVDVLGRAGEPSYATTWDDVAAVAPELIVAAPCGFDAARAAREAADQRLPCRAVCVDANAYYSRPSPRIAEGTAQLGFLLHPDAVPDPGLPLIEVDRAAARAG
jgi:iron complex transport system substrate-binding protein